MLSSADLLLLWDDARSFEQLAAYSPIPVVLDGADGPANLSAAAVSPSLFPLLRATPQLGRVFTDADAVDGAHRIVLLSYSAWTNRFRSDPDIRRRTGRAQRRAPHRRRGPLRRLRNREDWTPLVVEPAPEPVDGGIVFEGAFSGIGRLRPRGSDNGCWVNRIGDKAILGVDPRESWPLLVNGVADYRTQYGPMHTFGVAVPVQMAVVQPIAVDCESQLQGCLLTGTSAGMVTFMGTVQSSFPGGATVGAPPPPTWCCANPSMRTSTRVTRSPSS